MAFAPDSKDIVSLNLYLGFPICEMNVTVELLRGTYWPSQPLLDHQEICSGYLRLQGQFTGKNNGHRR